jgi:membrane protease YdiL (CAAX protease family)
VLEVLAVAGTLYAIIYGGAAAAGYAKRFENPLLSVAVSTVLMVLFVTLFSMRDKSWRQSLSVERRSWKEWLGFGVAGFFATYGINIVLGLSYFVISKVTGGNPNSLAQSKAEWTTQLADVPLWAMLLLAALAGFWEELVFRGFILGRLRAAFAMEEPLRRDLTAVLLTSLIFGFGHGYQGPFGLAQTSIVGMVLGLLTLWRGSIWPALVAHVGIDAFGLVMIKVLKPTLEKVLKGELKA